MFRTFTEYLVTCNKDVLAFRFDCQDGNRAGSERPLPSRSYPRISSRAQMALCCMVGSTWL
jgi:hypothetical protein